MSATLRKAKVSWAPRRAASRSQQRSKSRTSIASTTPSIRQPPRAQNSNLLNSRIFSRTFPRREEFRQVSKSKMLIYCQSRTSTSQWSSQSRSTKSRSGSSLSRIPFWVITLHLSAALQRSCLHLLVPQIIKKLSRSLSNRIRCSWTRTFNTLPDSGHSLQRRRSWRNVKDLRAAWWNLWVDGRKGVTPMYPNHIHALARRAKTFRSSIRSITRMEWASTTYWRSASNRIEGALIKLWQV